MTTPDGIDGNGTAAAARRLADTWEREMERTLAVLRAYPEEKDGLKPHPVLKSARELAWVLAAVPGFAHAAVVGPLDLGGGFPPAPPRMRDVVETLEGARAGFLEALRSASADQLAGTVQFPSGPGTMGEWPRLDFLTFLLHDHIHHRGQFSVYLRMADAKVPSIYGPSADEPWL